MSGQHTALGHRPISHPDIPVVNTTMTESDRSAGRFGTSRGSIVPCTRQQTTSSGVHTTSEIDRRRSRRVFGGGSLSDTSRAAVWGHPGGRQAGGAGSSSGSDGCLEVVLLEDQDVVVAEVNLRAASSRSVNRPDSIACNACPSTREHRHRRPRPRSDDRLLHRPRFDHPRP